MTVAGSEVSLAAGGSAVVIGSSTDAVAPHITAGFGTGANGTAVQVLTGDAETRWSFGWCWGWAWRWVLAWMVGAAVLWS